MKTKILATLGAAAFAMGASVTASQAQIIAQPGETMGVALGAPLPEGVFFVDLESYGKRDNVPGHLGVNIPLVAWSTPFSFYDTRIEVLYAAPFTHIDQPGNGLNRVDSYSQALLIGGAHDFGNGFNAALFGEVRPQDNFTQAGRGTAAGFRLGLSYVKDGFNASATFHYFGDFGGKDGNVILGTPGFRDNAFVDFTLAKTFDKVTVGFVGSAWTDVGNAVNSGRSQAGIQVGGLVGYDFGKFTLQAMVTREVANRAGGYGLGATSNEKETRGWMRLIVPLYVAPAAPVVKARY